MLPHVSGGPRRPVFDSVSSDVRSKEGSVFVIILCSLRKDQNHGELESILPTRFRCKKNCRFVHMHSVRIQGKDYKLLEGKELNQIYSYKSFGQSFVNYLGILNLCIIGCFLD